MTRQRGRPAGPSDAKQQLVAAARELFAAKGFTATSMRSVAKQVGVDPSLVVHYFGSKEGLLAATLELPFNPAERLAAAIAGGRDGFGERLVRTFVSTWDPHRDTFATLIRSAMSGEPFGAPVIEVARGIVAVQLTEMLGDPLRADLIVSQILGLGLARYVVALDPLATAAIDEVVAAYGPAIQALVV